MKLSIEYETDETCNELREEQTYWNSWDAELFTVVSISDETVTIVDNCSGSVELVDRSFAEPDNERIVPVTGRSVNIGEQ